MRSSGVAIAQSRGRRAEMDSCAHNRVRKFARGIAVACKSEMVLEAIEIAGQSGAIALR